METRGSALAPARAVRNAAIACAVLAVLVAVGGVVALQQPLAGAALSCGLLLGALNGVAARRLINLPVPFLATSLLRLSTLSVIGLGIGIALGLERIWLVLLGLGLAQFTLSAAALRETLRR